MKFESFDEFVRKAQIVFVKHIPGDWVPSAKQFDVWLQREFTPIQIIRSFKNAGAAVCAKFGSPTEQEDMGNIFAYLTVVMRNLRDSDSLSEPVTIEMRTAARQVVVVEVPEADLTTTEL